MLAAGDLGFAFGGWWFAGFGGVFVWFRVGRCFRWFSCLGLIV